VGGERVALSAAALLLTSCFATRYVGQAGFGQLALWSEARPIADVLADPDTDARTVALLQEVGAIVDFGERHGLRSRGNYTRYVDLGREAVVWFITASRPLAFEPKLWRFPIAGSFPYLGWFDQRAARRHRDQLRADGWDVYVRPVQAYSTGGWFRDPVLSTMLLDEERAVRYLANTLLHELVHANVLVNDQSTFNESVASFIGDELAGAYLRERYGAGSAEVAAYQLDLADDRAQGARLARAYAELDTLYRSSATDEVKRAGKATIMSKLRAELSLRSTPNNAMLQGFKTYNSGFPQLAELFEACGRSWPRLIAAVKGAEKADFAEEQMEDLSEVIPRLSRSCR
jgi:predicted aminopeptidase